MSRAKTVILEVQYLPSIQYFAKFIQYEKVCIERWEHYTKGSYRNRCHLASANGLLRLSIPLKKGKNEQQPITEVQIAYDDNWPSQHWQSIRSAYGKAPFFEFYSEELKEILLSKPKFLFDLNLQLLDWLLENLPLYKSYEFTDSYQNPPAAPIIDFRNGIFPKKNRQKEDLNFKPSKYSQVFEEKVGFLPNLSVLDLLFCTGNEAGVIIEKCLIQKKP